MNPSVSDEKKNSCQIKTELNSRKVVATMVLGLVLGRQFCSRVNKIPDVGAGNGNKSRKRIK